MNYQSTNAATLMLLFESPRCVCVCVCPGEKSGKPQQHSYNSCPAPLLTENIERREGLGEEEEAMERQGAGGLTPWLRSCHCIPLSTQIDSPLCVPLLSPRLVPPPSPHAAGRLCHVVLGGLLEKRPVFTDTKRALVNMHSSL